jgi:hypothetical protein
MTNLQGFIVTVLLAFCIGATIGIAFIREEQIALEVVGK